MASKRGFDQVGSPENGSPEPHASNDAGPYKKQKQQPSKSKNRPSEGSSQWVRKRVRNIERLLNRNQDLPANVRNDLERELAAHKTAMSDKAFQKKRGAMISKYHMVRFFERKKAMRLAKQLRKRIDQGNSPEETEELKRLLHIAEVDEAYTQHFPHIETYVSLYKSEPTKEDDKEEDKAAKTKALLEAERPPMWSTIEQAMKEGSYALRNLRERRTSEDSKGRSQTERRPQKSKPATTQAKPATKPQPKQQPKEKAASQDQSEAPANRRERRRLMRESGAAAAAKDDSDDGGFFEEG
ncbi:rRNA-processing protein efg1 [Neonectria punicea]|uniref:rRNA-processing protein EFG1 n=1 Tax=Neonectria punicea TaxID=979145 RepID=A0ABR1GMC5_9HYPO